MTNKYLKAVWQIICFARSKIHKFCKLTCFSHMHERVMNIGDVSEMEISLIHTHILIFPVIFAWPKNPISSYYRRKTFHMRLNAHLAFHFDVISFLSSSPCPSSNLQHKQKHHLLWRLLYAVQFTHNFIFIIINAVVVVFGGGDAAVATIFVVISFNSELIKLNFLRNDFNIEGNEMINFLRDFNEN